MTIDRALEITNQVLNENGLTDWVAVSNRRKRAFGVCDYSLKRVELSSILTPNCTDESTIETIYHEVAHALCPGHNHDKLWKKVCIGLGGNGERCGGDENYINGDKQFLVEMTKYTRICPVCGNKTPASRRPKINSSCGLHNTKGYNEKYKLILVQNY
jgi:hypothetical protein